MTRLKDLSEEETLFLLGIILTVCLILFVGYQIGRFVGHNAANNELANRAAFMQAVLNAEYRVKEDIYGEPPDFREDMLQEEPSEE